MSNYQQYATGDRVISPRESHKIVITSWKWEDNLLLYDLFQSQYFCHVDNGKILWDIFIYPSTFPCNNLGNIWKWRRIYIQFTFINYKISKIFHILIIDIDGWIYGVNQPVAGFFRINMNRQFYVYYKFKVQKSMNSFSVLRLVKTG